MTDEIPLKEKIDKLFDKLDERNPEKIKNIKIPRKAKIKKRKLKKGWVGILKIDENGNITGERQKVIDGTIKTNDGTYHSTDGREILHWEGKYPVIIQPNWRKNPLNVRQIATKVKDKDGNVKYVLHETHGQKLIMARMITDTIKIKKEGAKALIWIIGVAVAGYILYSLITGGF